MGSRVRVQGIHSIADWKDYIHVLRHREISHVWILSSYISNQDSNECATPEIFVKLLTSIAKVIIFASSPVSASWILIMRAIVTDSCLYSGSPRSSLKLLVGFRIVSGSPLPTIAFYDDIIRIPYPPPPPPPRKRPRMAPPQSKQHHFHKLDIPLRYQRIPHISNPQRRHARFCQPFESPILRILRAFSDRVA